VNELTKKCDVLRVDGDDSREVKDDVVTESAVQINLNDTELVTMLSCAYDEKELGVGFLRTEGFIDGMDDIVDFEQKGSSLYFTIPREKFDKESRVQKYITSGCGRGVSFAIAKKSLKLKDDDSGKAPIVSAEQISDLMREFQGRSETFKNTGGVHSAALCTAEEVLFFSEDIGRHNAVDRVIGKALLEGVATGDKVLLSSGRISSEIARKVAFADVPVLVSRSAPTTRALKIAQELGLTVVGFARGRRMNIYMRRERVGIHD
jgi:FdhD protein